MEVSLRTYPAIQPKVQNKFSFQKCTRVLKDLYNSKTFVKISDQIETINLTYKDVSKGDAYTLVYYLNEATTLLLNNKPKITIKGAEFALH